jgi:hypothetical protein
MVVAFHFGQVLDIHRKTLICSGSLGITPKAILTWAGFSDIGVLYVMDSEGMVFALVKVRDVTRPLLSRLAPRHKRMCLPFPSAGRAMDGSGAPSWTRRP